MANAPAWFDYQKYFDNKLKMMGAGWDTLTLKKAFNDAGYADAQDGGLSVEAMYQHFVDYGAHEGVSPSPLFDNGQYLYFKGVDYFGTTQVSQQQLTTLNGLFAQASLSPWEHYVRYWDEGFSSKGVFINNPSQQFDTNAYMTAKLAQMGAGYTMAQLIADFKAAGVTPLEHYELWGKGEGLVPGSVVPGETFQLTAGIDEWFGTPGNDYISGKIGTLQDSDYIDGGAGIDTLYAHLAADSSMYGPGYHALQPEIRNVENITFRVQASAGGGGNNLTQAMVDAGDIHGMTRLKNDNSRATLSVEDVRTNSNQMTITWADSDPGDSMDFNVYFDPQHLKSDDASVTGTLQLRLMDVKNADPTYTPDSTPNVQPLAEQPFDKFSFKYVGSSQYVTLYLQGEDGLAGEVINGPDATYDTLLKAFRDAITRQGLDGVLKADLGNTYSASTTVDGTTYNSQTNIGQIIVLTSLGDAIEAPNTDPNTGWGVTTGNVPSVGGIVWSATPASSSECPLIRTNIELDNVGRVQWTDARGNCLPDEAIWGSESGDMVVGSMAGRGGVERFDVKVDRGSWLSSLSSTNETLRMVTVDHADINGDGKAGYNVASQANDAGRGQLFIGHSMANDHNSLDLYTAKAGFLTIGTTASPSGLVDVKEFDASKFSGDLNIAANITAKSFDKYLNDVDGVYSIANLYAPRGDFHYQLGTANDRLNMSVNAGIAADNDFKLVVDAGTGNDRINFGYTDLTQNRMDDMIYLRNVTLNGGDGNDNIRFWGARFDDTLTHLAGEININGGAGNDTIYAGQRLDSLNGITGDHDAIFVFNTGPNPMGKAVFATTDGAQPLNNDLLGTNASATFTAFGVAGSVVSVEVTYKGFTSRVALHTVTAADVTAGSFTMSTRDINQAIIKAINADAAGVLDKVLLAIDGAADSLIIRATSDGHINLTELSIDWVGASSANGSAAYDTQYALNPATAGATLAVTFAADGGTAGLYHATGAAAPTIGVWYSFTADGTTYYTQTAAASADDAGLIALINGAKDAQGNLFFNKFQAADIIGAGTFDITATDSLISHTFTGLQPLVFTHNAEGTDIGTFSKNWVNGGAGDDVIVLNVHSTVAYNDILILDGTTIGNDKVFGFNDNLGTSDVRPDKINIAALLHANATGFDTNLAGAGLNKAFVETGDQGTSVGHSTSGAYNVVDFLDLYASCTANSMSVVFWQGETGRDTNLYTVFQVKNDGTAALTASEVTVLGTIKVEDLTAIVTGDLSLTA